MSVVSETMSLENAMNNPQNPENPSEDYEMNGKCNLIVNYLPHDIDDNGLRAMFEEFGELASTKVVRDKNTRKSLGYGFVKFTQEYSAMVAVERMNGFNVGGKVLKVSIARPPSLEIRNCKLYVTNLPKEYTEMDIMGLFQEFGDIIECRLLKEPGTTISKGVAFVQFNLKQQANNALSLNGCQLEGSPRPLIVKYAEDQQKRKELSRLHNLSMNNNYRGGGGPGLHPHHHPHHAMMHSPMGGPMGGMGGMNHPHGMNHMGGPMGGHHGHAPHHQQHPHHHDGNPMMGGGGPGAGGMNLGMNNAHPNMKFRDQKPNDGPNPAPPLGSPYFFQSQNLTNMYNSHPQPSPPPMPMIHSPIGNNRVMFPPTNPGTPPGMGGGMGGGGEFTGRRTPRAPKNKSFGFDNQGPPPGVGLQPAGVGNWFPPQQLPFMPNGGLPPPPALHPNSSNLPLSPRFFPMQSPQHPLGGDNNMHLGQLFPHSGAGGAGAGNPGPPRGLPMQQQQTLPPPGMANPIGGVGMPGNHGNPNPVHHPAMSAPPGIGHSSPPGNQPQMPPGMGGGPLGGGMNNGQNPNMHPNPGMVNMAPPNLPPGMTAPNLNSSSGPINGGDKRTLYA